MTTLDLGPATDRMIALLDTITDDQLTDPTPCPDYPLAALLDHVNGFAMAFTAAAVKRPLDARPTVDASALSDGWRTEIPVRLRGLAEAWRDPEAWTGMTAAGGIDIPGEVAGVVAADELVLHGWDVASATGQTYDCDRATLDAVEGFVTMASAPDQEGMRQNLFGPVVAVPGDAPQLDRIVGMAGRDPNWSPR